MKHNRGEQTYKQKQIPAGSTPKNIFLFHGMSVGQRPHVFALFCTDVHKWKNVTLTMGVSLAKVCRSLMLLLTYLRMFFTWELRFWLAAYAHSTPILQKKGKNCNAVNFIPGDWKTGGDSSLLTVGGGVHAAFPCSSWVDLWSQLHFRDSNPNNNSCNCYSSRHQQFLSVHVKVYSIWNVHS